MTRPDAHPGVYQRGRKYSCVWNGPPGLDGKRRQHTKSGFDSAAEAATYRAEQLRLRDTGQLVEPSRLSFAAYLDQWWETALTEKAENTRTAYRSAIDLHIKPVIGHRLLTKLTPWDLQSYFDDRRQRGRADGKGGLGAASLRQHWNVLSQSLAQAVRWRLITSNPLDGCTPPAQAKRNPDCPPLEEGERLLDATRGTWLYLPLLLLLSTGIRRGEALGLRWADCELGATTGVLRLCQQVQAYPLRVVPKLKGKPRRVFISGPIVEALKEHRKAQEQEKDLAGPLWQDHDLVICRPDGVPRNPATFTSAVQRVGRACGASLTSPHKYRHLHASYLLNQGVPPHQVAKRLGHSPNLLLSTYAHAWEEEEAAVGVVAATMLTRAKNPPLAQSGPTTADAHRNRAES